MTEEKAKGKGMSTGLKVGLGCCGGCLGLVIIIIIIAAITGNLTFNGSSSGKASPTATAIKTATVAPTPKSTVSYSAQLSDAEKSYADEIVKQMTDMSKAINEIGVFLKSNSDISAWTADQKKSVEANMVIVQNTYKQASKMSPPDRFKAFHTKYVEGNQKYYNSMALLSDGINHKDAKKITESTVLMSEGNVLIEEATAKLTEVMP